MIIRWTRKRPFVYESFMGYDDKTRTLSKQKYEYMGTYESWRAKNPNHGYTNTLKPHQCLKLKQWQIEILAAIDVRARVRAKVK